MVVAGQYNTQRTKATDRVWKATDFVRRPGEPDEIPEPDPEVLERFFDDWMAGTNKAVKA